MFKLKLKPTILKKLILLIVSVSFYAITYGQKASPLFVYDFELQKFSISERVAFLEKIGFKGITFPVNNLADLQKFDQYVAATSTATFTIPTVFHSYNFTEGNKNQQVWKTLTDKVKGKNIKMWLTFNVDTALLKKFDKEILIAKVKEMADYMAQSGVEMVIYPHDKTLIESMAQSVEIIKATGSKNVFTSFHLCHELRAGNAKNLLAIGRKYAPYIKLASISGADYMAPYKHTGNWDDAIKPLYNGDFDTQEFIQVLAQIGYSGPTFLHTFGIKTPQPEEHLTKSLARWNEMNAKVAEIQKTDISKTLDAPESAYFDKGSQAWYVSSLGGGFVSLEEDGYGWISKLDKDGKIIKGRWVEGLNAPTGMAAVGNKLYVGDRGCLVEIDIKNAKIIRRIALANSEFVNDVAAAPNGDIYISDTFTNTVYRLPANGKIEVFLKTDSLEYPNGLWVDGNQLIVATWGPMTNRATFETSRKGTLKKIDLATKKLTNVGAGLPIANMDAVVKYGTNYYVSDWTGGRLLRVDEAGKVKVMLTGFNQFADLGIDLERGVIMMPEMSTGRVFTIQLEK
jgi:sugar phosphate isomerase/epimerase/sugar lactone lactonase YvrE